MLTIEAKQTAEYSLDPNATTNWLLVKDSSRKQTTTTSIMRKNRILVLVHLERVPLTLAELNRRAALPPMHKDFINVFEVREYLRVANLELDHSTSRTRTLDRARSFFATKPDGFMLISRMPVKDNLIGFALEQCESAAERTAVLKLAADLRADPTTAVPEAPPVKANQIASSQAVKRPYFLYRAGLSQHGELGAKQANDAKVFVHVDKNPLRREDLLDDLFRSSYLDSRVLNEFCRAANAPMSNIPTVAVKALVKHFDDNPGSVIVSTLNVETKLKHYAMEMKERAADREKAEKAEAEEKAAREQERDVRHRSEVDIVARARAGVPFKSIAAELGTGAEALTPGDVADIVRRLAPEFDGVKGSLGVFGSARALEPTDQEMSLNSEDLAHAELAQAPQAAGCGVKATPGSAAITEAQRVRVSYNATHVFLRKLVKKLRAPGGGLKPSIRKKAARDDKAGVGVRMQILAFLEIAIGIRRTFLVQSDPDDPLISGPNGLTTAAVDVPTEELLDDLEVLFESYWKYPSRPRDGPRDGKVSVESFRALGALPAFILLVRDLKLLTYTGGALDPRATSTGRFVAFDPSVVEAAGSLALLARLLNECIAAAIGWGLRQTSATALTTRARDYALARISPAIQIVGRQCSPRQNNGQYQDLLRHLYAELQVALFIEYPHYLAARECSRMTLKYHFILHHGAARKKPLVLAFDIARDGKLVCEIEARLEAAGFRRPNITITSQMVSTYDAVRLLVSEFP